MEHTTTIKNLFQHTLSQISTAKDRVVLKENQVVLGHVLKLFPNQKAMVQVGQSKLIAQLETTINANQNYWFTVKGNEQQGLKLKILKQVEGDTSSQTSQARGLLDLFQQRPTKANTMLAKELISENIPVTKEQFLAANKLLKELSKNGLPEKTQSIISAIKQNYPLSSGVIEALTASRTSAPLVSQIENLQLAIQQEKILTPPMKQLTEIISNLMKNYLVYDVNKLIEGLKTPQTIQTLTDREKQIITNMTSRVDLSKENDVVRLLNVSLLNGQTLLQHDSGPIQHIVTQIPLFMNSHYTDLTIQWNGKKQDDGKIDPAYCRILFYLQLPSLKEIMIDVQIQNRIMNITIRNDNEALGKIIASAGDGLKGVLSQMNYHVSAIIVKPFEIDETIGKGIPQASSSFAATSYTGVDIRI